MSYKAEFFRLAEQAVGGGLITREMIALICKRPRKGQYWGSHLLRLRMFLAEKKRLALSSRLGTQPTGCGLDIRDE